jgi:hypothetical protein
MYSYCYVLFCIFSFHRAFWHSLATLTDFSCAFSSAVRQMPGYNSQKRGTTRTLPKLIVLFCLLLVCKCVLYYCHWMSTQLQLTNMSIYIYLSNDQNFLPKLNNKILFFYWNIHIYYYYYYYYYYYRFSIL